MNNEPIQQLVDAAKLVISRIGYTGSRHSFGELLSAIAAVESAQVETRWQIQYQMTEDSDWLDLYPPFTSEAAMRTPWDKILLPEIHRIIRIDTYRTVESNQ